DAAPPVGAMDVCFRMSGGFARLLSFHSLSKRSNVPGLRSGFVAGSPELIRAVTRFRNTCAPQVPIPVLTASAAAWDDESYVEENRARYRVRFEIARRILGNHRGFRLPDGGFYLWLYVGDGPAFAKALLRESFCGFMGVAVWRLCGAALLLLGAAVLLTIAGHDAADPSFDVATGKEAANWLGNTGGYGADLLLRVWGLSALALAAAFAAW